MSKIYRSAEELIGSTPLVELERIEKKYDLKVVDFRNEFGVPKFEFDYESAAVSITAANGYKIQSVTILYSIKDSGVLVYDGEEYESGTAINVDSLTEFVFSASSTSGSSGKVLIKSIIVTYSK